MQVGASCEVGHNLPIGEDWPQDSHGAPPASGTSPRTAGLSRLAAAARHCDNSSMTPPRLLFAHDRRVALDYGQFYLRSGECDPDLAVQLLDDALQNGIAQRDGIAVVVSPHQNNFDMAFRVELWSAEPTPDLDEWQEASELHLDVSEYGLHYDSPTLESVDLQVPVGSYHALVTGRDFVTCGWPGSTTPGDKWRIRLFPSQGPGRARRMREFIEP